MAMRVKCGRLKHRHMERAEGIGGDMAPVAELGLC